MMKQLNYIDKQPSYTDAPDGCYYIGENHSIKSKWRGNYRRWKGPAERYAYAIKDCIRRGLGADATYQELAAVVTRAQIRAFYLVAVADVEHELATQFGKPVAIPTVSYKHVGKRRRKEARQAAQETDGASAETENVGIEHVA